MNQPFENLCKKIDGVQVLDQISFIVNHGDKIAFVGGNELAKTTLFQILAGELEPDSGSYKWGVTTSQAYFPKDNAKYFDNCEDSLIDWLRPYAKEGEQYDADIRGWLGRMLFSGEEALKQAKVLSGGERVRCMLCKMMISGANVLVLDEPTNHLDLESITALNNGMKNFKGCMLFTSHDQELMNTVANRIIEINGTKKFDKKVSYDEYIDLITQ